MSTGESFECFPYLESYSIMFVITDFPVAKLCLFSIQDFSPCILMLSVC
ncbi:hypothetical protein HMPREF9445_03090 [Bacteroides clarus YIT 12056]|uniref:Uncharacterized protein n=1 Tax=Bacteroides clarus YIT 12056 TaxID=762984 RepID=A0ABP2KS60_9BACE|nr:hypothetical protein HMPREF9445_03090 [Bacteroides clarus YIT 12056]